MGLLVYAHLKLDKNFMSKYIIKYGFMLLCLWLSACNLSKNKHLDVCTSGRAYEGERLNNPIDAASLNAQSAINLSQPFDDATKNRLDETLSWIVDNTQVTDMTVAVAVPGKGSWVSTRIVTPKLAQDIKHEDALFWWMSVGKAYTAAVMLQMAEEKKLNLDDTIEKWFPDIKNAKLITLNQLLTHTSGIYSFQEDEELRKQPGYKTPTELVAVSQAHRPLFCPNTQWYYSNTGYVLLGLLIEKIEQKSYAQVVDERILNPLKLTHTRVLSPNEFPRDLVLSAALDASSLSIDIPSSPFSAGNIVGNAGDMLIFLQALLTGKLYSESSLQKAFEYMYPMFDSGLYYGQGITFYKVDTADAKVNWIGHSGGAQHSNALIAFDRESGAYVAVSVNDNTPTTAIVARLLKAVKP